MRIDLVGPCRSAACAAVTPRCGIATRLEYERSVHPRPITCLCKSLEVAGGTDGPGGEVLPALNRPTLPVRPSQDEDANISDQDSSDLDSSDENITRTGLASREWLDSWQPTEIKGSRQYANFAGRIRRPGKAGQLPARPVPQSPRRPQKAVYIKGEGLAVNLKTKVAVQFVDQHERTLVIRDTKSQGHRGLWQLPSLPLHNTDCVHRQGIIIARGFFKTVPPKFPLKPHTFMSSQRLGQPMLVMILQVRVNHTEMSPGRCGFRKKDFEWVSSQQYESLCDEMSEVLYMRSTWNVRGRHPAVLSFHREGERKKRHRAANAEAGIPDFIEQQYTTQRRFMLFVAAACVYDQKAGRVLIAQRHKQKAGQLGKWEWPGGKVDPGETTHQTVVREIKEEVDLDLDVSALEPKSFIEKQFYQRNLVIVFYMCTKFSGTARGVEGQPIEWVTRSELQARQNKFLSGDDMFTATVLEEMTRFEDETGSACN